MKGTLPPIYYLGVSLGNPRSIYLTFVVFHKVQIRRNHIFVRFLGLIMHKKVSRSGSPKLSGTAYRECPSMSLTCWRHSVNFVITNADDSRVCRVFTTICLFVFHTISKNNAAKIIKVGIQTFHNESEKLIYFGVKRSIVNAPNVYVGLQTERNIAAAANVSHAVFSLL